MEHLKQIYFYIEHLIRHRHSLEHGDRESLPRDAISAWGITIADTSAQNGE